MKTTLILLSLLLVATPTMAQQLALTPLQQFLYNESGYAPPALATPQPVPVPPPQPYVEAYAAPPAPAYQPPVQYPPAAIEYEEQEPPDAPDDSSNALRMMLTSSGL